MSDEKKSVDTTEKALNKKVSRRHFVQGTGLAVGGLILGGGIGGYIGHTFGWKDEPAPKKEQTAPSAPQVDYTEAMQFFKRKEDFQVLSAATECIFPEDEHGPGAIGLGVPYFIDKQLAGPWGMNTDDYMKGPFIQPELGQPAQSPLTRQDIFLIGVRKLNEESKTRFEKPFYELGEEQQIEILQDFESGKVEMNKVSSAVFFAMLRTATLEGAYSDPLYGGNKNMEGWKMKEFPGAQMSYAHMVEEEEFVYIEPISLRDM